MKEKPRVFPAPVRLEYRASAGRGLSRFLAALMEGRIVGQRCPRCAKVYVPSRGACPSCGVALGGDVTVSDTGTLVSFCVVNIPLADRSLPLPYVYGSVLLDGADIPFPHLLQGLPVEEVRMGLRVRAEWVPGEDRKPSLESIRCFRPTGEPDAPFEAYQEHL
ncbi:Zn-ribbon domain-containing OB-fold protein [Myxococcus stipitatus]|uniref:Zn-ribbon domain-containing OB-fold protein n=1 Tax=Myxococcus stipitatus TaxID=83455 RepID=UPI0031451703